MVAVIMVFQIDRRHIVAASASHSEGREQEEESYASNESLAHVSSPSSGG